jgi:hypothetical protein
MKEKAPGVYGKCCVCGLPCYDGQELVVGSEGCLVRHKECVRARVTKK